VRKPIVRILLLATVVVALSSIAPAGAGGQIQPDATYTVTIAKTVDGVDGGADYDFELTCASDEGVGEASFVSIYDPTFPGFESSDTVEFTLAGGEDATFEVYVEFSRQTLITCIAVETGGTGDEPETTTVTCTDEDLVTCTDPVAGATAAQMYGVATLSWADMDAADAFGGDVGGASFAFTNVIAPAPTTTTTTSPVAPGAAAAAALRPAFTG
jgi:hypothetical protein